MPVYFKGLQISSFPCKYVFSLINFAVNKHKRFQTNSVVHSSNTTNKYHLHTPVENISSFHKSTYYGGIKILNKYPIILLRNF